ncbi:MAG TPA: aromatic amino acid transaminase, partial [Parachlamydiaceae bacterium]|nr:aromatic amino acid transaminase [Parachlamydiaceae bacterium]
VNLGIGAYKDAEGKSVVLTAVQKAEELLLKESLNKDYLPIEGEKNYILETAKLLFGSNQAKLEDGSIFGAQTVGGTAALRVGGEFLKEKTAEIFLPNLTWANHKLVFQRAGLKVDFYPYYNELAGNMDFDQMCQKFNQMTPGTVVLLHGTSHNPTGINPTFEEWKKLSYIIKEKKLFPFFDIAYQGFGVSIEEDAAPIRYFLEEGHEMLASYTYAKNMGLYGERPGALFAVAKNKAASQKTSSQIKQIVRSMYSNPPLHGARIVQKILQDEELKKEWLHELKSMRERVDEMRKAFVTGLLSKGEHASYRFMNKNQTGFFAYTGLNHDQIHRLRQDFAVYIPDGRINIAGLNPNNMDYVIESILSV